MINQNTISLSEKILIGLILISALVLKLLGFRFADEAFILAIISNISLIALLIYYISQTKVAPVSLAFLLMIMGVVGYIFLILNLKGYSILQILGYCGSILFVVLIFLKLSHKKNTSVYYYAAAVSILAQAVCFFIGDKFNSYGVILNYFLVGVIGTIKMNETQLDSGIDKGLTVYLVTGLVSVISKTIDVLN